jgi:hypothetical protein
VGEHDRMIVANQELLEGNALALNLIRWTTSASV